MIFCGDIACAENALPKFVNFPSHFAQEQFIANLEGTLVRSGTLSDIHSRRHGVYNVYQELEKITALFPIKCVSLANNHLFDAGTLDQTLQNLNELGITHTGAGNTLSRASKPASIIDKDQSYKILSFGWNIINCRYAREKTPGVNPYTPANVLSCVKRELAQDDKTKLICLFHWNYELELYPQPMDREIAMKIIDLGVEAVIGCHSHRVQPIEIYKGKPIVYGLGNFVFIQNFYNDKKLKFPDFVRDELLFEINHNNFFCHRLHFDPLANELHYVNSEALEEFIAQFPPPFLDYGARKYCSWYKKNKTSRFYLPTFSLLDNFIVTRMKLIYALLLGKFINILATHPAALAILKKLFRPHK